LVKHRARSCAAALLFLIGGVLPACSLLVDSDRAQCSTDVDCTARGDRFAGSFCVDSICQPEPRWSCLGTTPEPPAVTDEFDVTFTVQHLVSQKALPGVKVRLCLKLDVACTNSVSGEQQTDESGKVTFKIRAGFDGYARIEGDAIIPGLFFFNPPLARDLPSVLISIGSQDVIALLAQQAGAVQSADRGLALLSVRDCKGAPGEGVQLSTGAADPKAVLFYSEQGLPSSSAKQTDSSGYGGLLNAAPGTLTFSATVASTGQRVGQTTLLVQSGAITYGTVVPSGD